MPWRHIFGANLSHMTPEQASASLRRIQLRVGITGQPEVVRLTGLTERQITPAIIASICEKLAEHANLNTRKFDPTEQTP